MRGSPDVGLAPVHFEQIDDALDAVQFAQQLLSYLLVVEGLNSPLQYHDTFFIGAHDLATKEMWAVLKGKINSGLQFVGRDLGNRHKAPSAQRM